MSEILVVGLNASWQRIVEMDELNPGGINRVRKVTELGSGKGLNVAGILAGFGHQVHLLQVGGGHTGRKLKSEAEERGIHVLGFTTDIPTRTCTTLIHDDQQTEIIEPFVLKEGGLEQGLVNLCEGMEGKIDVMVICGSIPDGIESNVYLELVKRVNPFKLVLDTVYGLEEDLLARADFLKINSTELETIFGQGVELSKSFSGLILETAGPENAKLYEFGSKNNPSICDVNIPHLETSVNCIGAGDTVTAGVVHGLATGMDHDEFIKMALAMGSASCMELLPARYNKEHFENLKPLVSFAREE